MRFDLNALTIGVGELQRGDTLPVEQLSLNFEKVVFYD